jgi:DNA-binding GntR family transcriptional regulator
MAQNQPMYRYIADDLRAQINDEQLRPNEKLPTEGDLSTKYDASRNTVREAIRRLTDEGLLEAGHVRGAKGGPVRHGPDRRPENRVRRR